MQSKNNNGTKVPRLSTPGSECQLDKLVQYLHDLVKAKYMQHPLLAVVLFFSAHVLGYTKKPSWTKYYDLPSHSARQ